MTQINTTYGSCLHNSPDINKYHRLFCISLGHNKPVHFLWLLLILVYLICGNFIVICLSLITRLTRYQYALVTRKQVKNNFILVKTTKLTSAQLKKLKVVSPKNNTNESNFRRVEEFMGKIHRLFSV